MLCYFMLGYTTCYIHTLCYVIQHMLNVMLYNICYMTYVMLYNMCFVML